MHSPGRSNLGEIVLANGRFAIGERLKPLLEAARGAGLVAFDDTETAFRTFFGLVGRDVQIRLLLGDKLRLSEAEIARDAQARDATVSDALRGGKGAGRCRQDEDQPPEGNVTCASITIVMPTSI